MARALGVAAVVIFLATLTIYAFSLSQKPDARRARRRLSQSPFKKL
jgi:cbb3-type cytochrome oxidase subunit 3